MSSSISGLSSSISGRHFCDIEGDGRDLEEPGAANLRVMLYDVNQRKVIAITTTDSNGLYRFDNLDAGKYQVIFAPDPDGNGFSDANRGGEQIDSDVTWITANGQGTTNVINVASNVAVTGVNAGTNKQQQSTDPGSLSGRYFCDENDNNQDDAEPGVAGVNVMLLDANGNPTGQTTTTAADGSYSFGNLAPGTYGVKFTDSVSGKTLIDPNVGPDATDSDAIDQGNGVSTISNIQVQSGQDTPDNDAGVEDVTDEPLGSIGDFVFLDENSNGVQNLGDDGVAGVTVNLKDANGNVIRTTTTDANGKYLFEDLVAGDYSVGFVAPNGFEFTKKDIANNNLDAADSDADTTTGMTDIISLAPGEDIRTVDAGLVEEIECINVVGEGTGALTGLGIWIGGQWTGQLQYTIVIDANKLFPGSGMLTEADKGSLSIDFSNFEDTVVDNGLDRPTSWHVQEQLNTYKFSWVKPNFGDYERSLEEVRQLRADLRENDLELTATYTVDGVEKKVCLKIDVISTYNVGTPIALDLNDDGEIGVTGETSSIDKDADAELGRTVEFDLDADGELDTIEWFDGSGDGILVDTALIGHNGEIDGSALFGDQGGLYNNGYDKLALRDANGDGMISGNELKGLALWIDDGDAVLEDGELKSAEELGIASISTDMQIVLDAEGRELMQSVATTTDGREILSEDVWFAEAEGADALEADEAVRMSENYVMHAEHQDA